jgi:hypothetical protein
VCSAALSTSFWSNPFYCSVFSCPYTMSLKAQSRTRRDVSLFARFIKYLRLMYYQYEVTFSAYVLTPGEKTVLNTIVLSIFSLLLVGIIAYLPPLMTRAAVRLAWLYNGIDDKFMVNPVNHTASAWSEMRQLGF